MQLPIQLIDSIMNTKGFNQEAFASVHTSGEQITSVRINSEKITREGIANHSPFTIHSQIPWTDSGFYLDSRPSFTFDPLFHAGCYYVQEASSMFLEQALKQTVDLSKQLKVLDLCAAPGGKSTHIQSLISKDSLLVSNEVIRSRANILKDNIIKWGCENVVVTNNDPRDFSKLENYFDVIVVDAPCSGSGLFRRDPEAIAEWSENNVQLCSQRQQRILADAWPSLKKDGILIYSTCSYSKEEDEEIGEWIRNNFLAKECILSVELSWGIVESGNGYRFWPDKVKGEGFFLSCFQKLDGDEGQSIKVKKRPEPVTKKEMELVEKWVKTGSKAFIKNLNTVYAWPLELSPDFSFLLESLRVIYSGLKVGELMRDKLVPDHALSMSNSMVDSIKKIELTKEESIKYLQRKDLQLLEKEKGWHLATYREHPLGWLNVLSNRINNYYPKELRILKDI
ncbi:MAG: hypothetical protein WBC06_16435 [Chitinophagaceae bacterium]